MPTKLVQFLENMKNITDRAMMIRRQKCYWTSVRVFCVSIHLPNNVSKSNDQLHLSILTENICGSQLSALRNVCLATHFLFSLIPFDFYQC